MTIVMAVRLHQLKTMGTAVALPEPSDILKEAEKLSVMVRAFNYNSEGGMQSIRQIPSTYQVPGYPGLVRM